MSRFNLHIIVIIMFGMITAFAAATVAFADNKNMVGWERGSEYDQLYDPKERDQIKGDIVKFVKVTPLPGMAPGTALILDEGGGDKVVVHICPESFASGREIGLKRGEWVKIKGAWAEIGDETVFIAAKIKKDGGHSYKVRLTSDGTPFWTMSAELLAKERASD
ncbi:MAG: hypothetical protein HKP41_02235 [Desulfobacterales bacterium]|nr:hypothetical protein [Deltaproteobacteria bacterium]NNK93148.1 hypothetical protein [Desulfobacterales bacterium]